MGKQILICDDAAFMRMMLKDILTKNGYEVVAEAENGVKAVEKYKAAKKQFEESYGPLVATSSMDCDRWAWADMPLPWEGGR